MSARRRRSFENEESENDNSVDGSSDDEESSVEIKQVHTTETSLENNTISIPDNGKNETNQSVDKNVQRSVERKGTKKDPATVPRSGRFFLHDDRDDQTKHVHNRPGNNIDKEHTRISSGRAKKSEDSWSHDKFVDDDAHDNRKKRAPKAPTFTEKGVKIVSIAPIKSNRVSSETNDTTRDFSRGVRNGPPRTAPEASTASYSATSHGAQRASASETRNRSNETEKKTSRGKYNVENSRSEKTTDAPRYLKSGEEDVQIRNNFRSQHDERRPAGQAAGTNGRARSAVSGRRPAHQGQTVIVSQSVNNLNTPSKGPPPPGLTENPLLNPTAREFQPTPTRSSSATIGDEDKDDSQFAYQSTQQQHEETHHYSGSDYDQYAGTGSMDMYAASAAEHYSHQQSVYLQQQHLAHQMAQMGLGGSDLVLDAYGNAMPLLYGGGYHQAVVSSGAAYENSSLYSGGVDSTWYGPSDQQQQSGTVYYSMSPQQQPQQAFISSSEQSSATA